MKYLEKCLAVLLAAMLLLFSCAACTPSGSPSDTAATEEGTSLAPAPPSDSSAGSSAVNTPDFTVLNADGETVQLSDFFGKPIVLNFWASWCPPCKAELPDFEAACKKYEGKVTFLMVNLTDGQRETVEIAKSFIASEGYTFPVYFDTNYEASYKYGLSSIPQTFFIGEDGEIVAKATGMISASQLEQGIGMIYTE